MRTRTVLLLGRRPSVDWGRLRDTLRSGDDFAALSLGYPVTTGQRAALLKAEALAAEAGAWFDALLVTSVQEARNALAPDDEITVAARGRQGKYLRSALRQDEARYP